MINGDPLLHLFLPIALGITMLGLGLFLTPADFRRVLSHPLPVLVALFCQVVLMPVLCLLVVRLFGLQSALAVGMLLIAASPGGTAAIVYSHLAHGDVALNLTLTAMNSLVALLSMPLIVNLAVHGFMDANTALPLQFTKVIQLFAVVLGPVALGMALRHLLPRLAATLHGPVKLLSVLLLTLILVAALKQDWRTLLDSVEVIGAALLTFNLSGLALGYGVARLLRLGKPQAVAISMELGIHNVPLAVTMALSPVLLNNRSMAIPPATYGVLMLCSAALFTWFASRRKKAVSSASA